MPPENLTAASLIMLFIGVGVSMIAYLGKRMIDEQDSKLDDHERDITALKVDVAKAQGSTDALADQIRVLRHDVRDVKSAVDGVARHLMNITSR